MVASTHPRVLTGKADTAPIKAGMIVERKSLPSLTSVDVTTRTSRLLDSEPTCN